MKPALQSVRNSGTRIAVRCRPNRRVSHLWWQQVRVQFRAKIDTFRTRMEANEWLAMIAGETACRFQKSATVQAGVACCFLRLRQAPKAKPIEEIDSTAIEPGSGACSV